MIEKSFRNGIAMINPKPREDRPSASAYAGKSGVTMLNAMVVGIIFARFSLARPLVWQASHEPGCRRPAAHLGKQASLQYIMGEWWERIEFCIVA